MIERVWYSGGAWVVEKPAGLSTTSPPGTDSLESRLRQQFPDHESYLHVVHRLDRCVAGLVMVAVSKKAARLLSAQLATGKVTKTYQAIVRGRVVEASTRWEDWLRKLPDRAASEVVQAETPGAKQAITNVEVVRFQPADETTLLELSPVTGRTHQLRLQSAHRGHSILGDQQYGDPASQSDFDPNRIALLAQQLSFHDPTTGRRVQVRSKNQLG